MAETAFHSTRGTERDESSPSLFPMLKDSNEQLVTRSDFGLGIRDYLLAFAVATVWIVVDTS
jgi:hypothetical protein